MPLRMSNTDGEVINYYTSTGIKLKSEFIPEEEHPAHPPKTTNYFAGQEYENSKLKFIYFEEGRATYRRGEEFLEYFIKDHLGNTRVRIADRNGDNDVTYDVNDPSKDEVESVHHYYPFGMEWDTPKFDAQGNSLVSTTEKTDYTYNGKEFISDLDIKLHDYGFRYYEPSIAKFTTIDPLAETYSFQSGYAYAANNPISNIDFMGLSSSNVIQKAWDQGTGSYDNEGNKINGDHPIVQSLRSGFSDAIVALKERGYSQDILNSAETAFNNLIDNLLSGDVIFEGEIKGTFGARVAAGVRVASGIPLLPIAAAQGDINLSSVELFGLRGSLATKIDISKFNLSLVGSDGDFSGFFSTGGPAYSVGARGAVGSIFTGGIDLGAENEYSNTKGGLKLNQSSVSFNVGGTDYNINFQNRTINISTRIELDYRLGLFFTLSGKLGASINGSSTF